MQLTISSVDDAPNDLYAQVPIVADLIRQIPGNDRSDYWIAKSQRPITWINNNTHQPIHYLILAARWAGTTISAGAENLPVGIAYVTDESLLDDERLDFSKCEYAAIGISAERSAGKPAMRLTSFLVGNIGRAFGAVGSEERDTHSEVTRVRRIRADAAARVRSHSDR